MKIVDRKNFLKLPRGTLFQKYQPHIFENIQIKKSSTNIDYIFQDLPEIYLKSSEEMFAILENAIKTGCSFQLDFACSTRDGMFEEEQLFAVWEKKDVEALISRLKIALRDGY